MKVMAGAQKEHVQQQQQLLLLWEHRIRMDMNFWC
jgi:hypothetical protein